MYLDPPSGDDSRSLHAILRSVTPVLTYWGIKITQIVSNPT